MAIRIRMLIHKRAGSMRLDEMELAVVAQPEQGKDKEGDDKEEDLRDEALNHIREDCGGLGILRPGRVDPQHQQCHGNGKNAVHKRLQPVLRDMVFQTLYLSRHDTVLFLPWDMNVPPSRPCSRGKQAIADNSWWLLHNDSIPQRRRYPACQAHLYCPVHAPFHGDPTMKILGINASPKGDKSQTRRLVMGVLEGARQAGRT